MNSLIRRTNWCVNQSRQTEWFTVWTNAEWWFDFRKRQNIFLFIKELGLGLDPIRHSTQSVLGAVSLGYTRWRSWLRHCGTSRKVAGSIPDRTIGIFHWLNPSDRTLALGSSQPVTEMSTRSISWGVAYLHLVSRLRMSGGEVPLFLSAYVM
jgi:hypothetical protein